MSNRVLVIPRKGCPSLPDSGAWSWQEWPAPDQWLWLPRAQAESDENHLQIIPYALLRNAAGEIWHYRRGGGDSRLQERLSCGVGGHIDENDTVASVAAMAERALRRELQEELAWQPAKPIAPQAWIYEGLSPVGRVHIGLLYILPWQSATPPVPVEGEPLLCQGFTRAAHVFADDRFELWSQLAARYLAAIEPPDD